MEIIGLRHFTVGEYHRMAEAGILGEDDRVELVSGVIREMSPKNRPHVVGTIRVRELFHRRLEGRASVYEEKPLQLRELDSEPEPDVMVCSNPDWMAYGTDRTEPSLVIEVADSSPQCDLTVKAGLYAQANIPDTGSSISPLADSWTFVSRSTEPIGAARRKRLALALRLSRGRISSSRFGSFALLPQPTLDSARDGAARHAWRTIR